LSKARAPKVEPAPIPPVAQIQTAPVISTPPAVAASTAANAPSTPTRSGPLVYREGDPDVVAPVVLNQTVPQWNVSQGARPAAWQPEAVLEVTIDESGSVVSAVLRKSFHPNYDPQLIKAALAWKYEPARREGMPVRYVKLIAIRLGSTP
jgi:TonB family protein